jgi:hypothetical protein
LLKFGCFTNSKQENNALALNTKNIQIRLVAIQYLIVLTNIFHIETISFVKLLYNLIKTVLLLKVIRCMPCQDINLNVGISVKIARKINTTLKY